MTYHMQMLNSPDSKWDLKLKVTDMDLESLKPFDRKYPFPLKLFDAAESKEDLISWSPDGRSLHVDAARFEDEVMETYKYLVQVPSFVNFRRQMRVYNFSWKIVSDDLFIFSHPQFTRDNRDLIEKYKLKNLSTQDRKARNAKRKVTFNKSFDDYDLSGGKKQKYKPKKKQQTQAAEASRSEPMFENQANDLIQDGSDNVRLVSSEADLYCSSESSLDEVPVMEWKPRPVPHWPYPWPIFDPHNIPWVPMPGFQPPTANWTLPVGWTLPPGWSPPSQYNMPWLQPEHMEQTQVPPPQNMHPNPGHVQQTQMPAPQNTQQTQISTPQNMHQCPQPKPAEFNQNMFANFNGSGDTSVLPGYNVKFNEKTSGIQVHFNDDLSAVQQHGSAEGNPETRPDQPGCLDVKTKLEPTTPLQKTMQDGGTTGVQFEQLGEGVGMWNVTPDGASVLSVHSAAPHEQLLLAGAPKARPVPDKNQPACNGEANKNYHNL